MDERADWLTAVLAALAAVVTGVLAVILLGAIASGFGLIHPSGDKAHVVGDALVSLGASLLAGLASFPIVRLVVERRAGIRLGLMPLLVTAVFAGVFLLFAVSLPLYLFAWLACARFARGVRGDQRGQALLDGDAVQ